jgi:deoxyribose-phosphate aldolase
MKEEEYNFEAKNKFSYFDKVDLFTIEYTNNIPLVCALASEHGFRGIVTAPSKLPDLQKELAKSNYSDRKIVSSCLIDYPHPSMSINLRTYAITAAKESGASEIEIMLPMGLISERSISKINNDIETLSKTCSKLDMSIRYVIDCNEQLIDDTIKNKLSKMFCINSIKGITIKTSYNNIDSSVMMIRYFKSKTPCNIKAFVAASKGEDVAIYTKAGADSVLLSWLIAPRIIYEYESLIENEK